MNLPTILRSADGAIDVPYEVISEKNTLLGTLRGAANKIWTPIDRFVRRASGKVWRDQAQPQLLYL